jgi:hypothetical protein
LACPATSQPTLSFQTNPGKKGKNPAAESPFGVPRYTQKNTFLPNAKMEKSCRPSFSG